MHQLDKVQALVIGFNSIAFASHYFLSLCHDESILLVKNPASGGIIAAHLRNSLWNRHKMEALHTLGHETLL